MQSDEILENQNRINFVRGEAQKMSTQIVSKCQTICFQVLIQNFESEAFFNKTILLFISIQKEFLERRRHSISQWTVWLYVFLFQFSSFLLFERLLMRGEFQHQASS